MQKKKQQLGMNPSTASYKLTKDILYSLIKNEKCFHCHRIRSFEKKHHIAKKWR